MKTAIIHNEDMSGVINRFGIQNKEIYNYKTVQRVADALEKGGHNVKIIDGNMYFIEALQEFMPRVMEGERMGMVFNMAYGIQGESRYTHLPSMMEMLGIPYVGSSPAGHALALDKIITKIIMQKHNIPTPEFWVFSTGSENMSDIIYPVIVKPKMEAVSYGLKIAENEKDLRESVRFIISEFKQQALVEHFIRGREFCIGLLGNGDPEAFPVLEIDLEGDPKAIQSAGDKLQKPRNKICPAQIRPEKAAEMVQLSKQAFNALGLRDFSRVDIRMDEDENIYLLEINSMASLGATGSYVQAAAAAGYDFPALVNKILEVASVRYFSQEEFFTENNIPGKTGKISFPVRIRTFLRGRQEQSEKLLSKMININNHTKSIEGVNAINRIIGGELKPMGFSEHIYPEVSTGNTVLFSNTPDKELDILFIAFSDSPVTFKKHRSCSFTQHKIYGSGAWEGKGGLAVLVSALKALRFTKLLKKIKIGILLTPDNTLYGAYSAPKIKSIASDAEYIIGLSGSDLKGSVILSRSGAALFECEVHLINPENSKDAANASMHFTKLLAEISSVSDEAKGLLVTPSDISIDSHFSPPFVHCESKISIRFNNINLARESEDILRGAAAKIKNKKVKVQIRGGIKRPPLSESEQSLELYSRLKKIAASLDLRTIKEHRWSSTNICFAPQDKAVIDGLGPIGTASKEDDEYILRHSLLDRSALLAVLLNEIRKNRS